MKKQLGKPENLKKLNSGNASLRALVRGSAFNIPSLSLLVAVEYRTSNDERYSKEMRASLMMNIENRNN